MTRDQWLQLECLAGRYSVEILRSIPFFTEEASGHLAYLRRIDFEAKERGE